MKVGDLTGGVYAGVRTACAENLRIGLCDFRECALDDFLNRRGIRLNLPAVIVCAVVFNREFDISIAHAFAPIVSLFGNIVTATKICTRSSIRL